MTASVTPKMMRTCPKSLDRLLTLKEAAYELNLPYFKVQRAVKRGDVPSYRLFNSRCLIRLSEVIAVIEASKIGGQK